MRQQTPLPISTATFDQLDNDDRLRFNGEYTGRYVGKEVVGNAAQSEILSRFWHFTGKDGTRRITVLQHGDSWYLDVGNGPVPIETLVELQSVVRHSVGP